jgi:fluoride ion exporter CrcB/FEX
VVIFIERKAYLTAFSYAAGTVMLSVLAVFIGMLIARRVLGS